VEQYTTFVCWSPIAGCELKYAVITFGCRVNQADSLAVEEDLLAHGAVPAAPDAGDLVVVNTCSVTATADQGARQTIRRIARDNPSARSADVGRAPDARSASSNPSESAWLTRQPNVMMEYFILRGR